MPPFLHLQNEDDNRTYLSRFIVDTNKSVYVSQVEGSQAQSECYRCKYQPLCSEDKPSPKAVWWQYVPAAASVKYRKLGGLCTWSPRAGELPFLVPFFPALYGRQPNRNILEKFQLVLSALLVTIPEKVRNTVSHAYY